MQVLLEDKEQALVSFDPVSSRTKKRKLTQLDEAKALLEQLHQNITSLTSLLSQPSNEQTKEQISALRTKGSLLLLQLRNAHRELQLDKQRQLDVSRKAKHRLDQLHLQYQNLLYERHHYEREIQLCRDYAPRNVVQELIPEEEFLRSAPAELTSASASSSASSKQLEKEEQMAKSHQMMLNRLAFELQERKKLGKELEELRARKVALGEAISAKLKFVNGLPDQLKALNTATQPLQQYFGTPVTERAEQLQSARHLPSPLYTLFCQLHAYKEAFDDQFNIGIVGSINDAIAHNAKESEDDYSTSKRASSSKRSSTISSSKRKAVSPDDIYKSHPLTVTVQFNDDGVSTTSYAIAFQYLPALNVVTAMALSSPTSTTPSPNKLDHSLLINLFPNDPGLDSPNPANQYLFKEGFRYSSVEPGRPYAWAQWMGGLDFLAPPHLSPSRRRKQNSKIAEDQDKEKEKEGEEVEPEEQQQEPEEEEEALFPARIQPNISSIIERIKRRLRVRRSLTTQLSLLAKHTIPSARQSSGAEQTVLASWREIPAEEFRTAESSEAMTTEEGELPSSSSSSSSSPSSSSSSPSSTSALFSSSSASSWHRVGSRYFKAIFQKDNEQQQLVAWIEVSPEYPVRPPRFRLLFAASSSSTSSNASNNSGKANNGRKGLSEAAKVLADPNAVALMEKSPVYDNDLKAIEARVNTFRVERGKDEDEENLLLSLQLQHLQFCFDALVDSRKGGRGGAKAMAAALGGGRSCSGRDRKPLSSLP